MYNSSGENVCSMKTRSVPQVVAMFSRERVRSSALVIAMPSHFARKSKVVTLPTRIESTSPELINESDVRAMVRSSYGTLSLGVRMTLVALFALLGWPHPTRDNDPGPSAARPCHWELTSLISRLHLSSGRAKVAAASAQQFSAEEDSKKTCARAA